MPYGFATVVGQRIVAGAQSPPHQYGHCVSKDPAQALAEESQAALPIKDSHGKFLGIVDAYSCMSRLLVEIKKTDAGAAGVPAILHDR